MTKAQGIVLGTSLALTALSGLSCGRSSYAGPNCASIKLDTPVSSLPVTGTQAAPTNLYQWSDPVILSSPEFACCKQGSCDAGCDELRARISVSALGGKYKGETCNAGGLSSCSIYVADGGIVAVSAFCFD